MTLNGIPCFILRRKTASLFGTLTWLPLSLVCDSMLSRREDRFSSTPYKAVIIPGARESAFPVKKCHRLSVSKLYILAFSLAICKPLCWSSSLFPPAAGEGLLVLLRTRPRAEGLRRTLGSWNKYRRPLLMTQCTVVRLHHDPCSTTEVFLLHPHSRRNGEAKLLCWAI